MKSERFPFRAMGSPCQLQLRGESGIEDVVHAAVAEAERLERKYSRFLDDSVTSHINGCAGESDGVQVDDETAALLDYADMGHRQSDGLFDVTSGVLRRVWDFKSGRIPPREAVDAVLPLIGWQHVGWERPRICLPRAGMQIDLGGFVKEYAADRIAELCREQGVRHGVVDLGGDIAIIGPHPDGSPWRIGIWHPRKPGAAIAKVEISAGAIASSGDYERFMMVDGRRYSHLLDPRTGWPTSGLASVSVVAPHCVVAGTLSTIAMLQGESGGVRWLSEAGLPHLCIDQQLKITGTLVSPQPAR